MTSATLRGSLDFSPSLEPDQGDARRLGARGIERSLTQPALRAARRSGYPAKLRPGLPVAGGGRGEPRAGEPANTSPVAPARPSANPRRRALPGTGGRIASSVWLVDRVSAGRRPPLRAGGRR